MDHSLTAEQINTISKWLEDAYSKGYSDGAAAKETQEAPETDLAIFPVRGCIPDISSFQPTPDYDKLCERADFVILRARYCSKTDNTFETRAKELNKRGMPFAVYDYVTLMSHANAKQQAEKIFELCNPYSPRIYYIDTEQLGTGVKRGEEMEYVKTYVSRLRELGVQRIGHYTGDWLFSTYYKKLQDLFDTLWIASYGKNTGDYDGVVLASETYTDKIDLHQYTDKGVLPGISARGDLSRLTGHKPLSWFTGREYSQEGKA